MTYLPDTRVVIIGGEHWNRTGKVLGTKHVQGNECVSVWLDRAYAHDRRLVVVPVEHLMQEPRNAA